MHILIIPSWYKAPDRPVVGSFFEEQARMLHAMGEQVGIFYPLPLSFSARWDRASHIPRPKDRIENDIPTYNKFVYAVVPKAERFNHWYFLRASLRKVRAYIDRFGKPDLIHSHAVYYAGIVARYLSERLEIPYVHTEHLTGLVHTYVPKTRSERNKVRVVFEQAGRVLIVSSKFRDDLVAEFGFDPGIFEVVPNVVSPRFFAARSVKPASRPFVFLTNSFLNPRKNHALLLRAFKLLSHRLEQVELRIGGYGEIQGELESLADELGIGEKVSFLGELSREAVVEELVNCHAFVLASTYETFGVVLVEALAVGRPVVSTDSGGPRDIVEEWNGYLVGEHDEEALCAEMHRMVCEYERFDQERISRECEARFSEEVVGRRIVDVYRGLARPDS